MPPVRPQMGGDPVRAGALADARDRDRIRFAVFRFRHRGVTRLPQRGDMIDVYSQSKCSHCFVIKSFKNGERFLDFARNDKTRATEVDRALRARCQLGARGALITTCAERPFHLEANGDATANAIIGHDL